MTEQDSLPETGAFLERSLGTCSSNIKRHSRAAVAELSVVLVILGLVASLLLFIAEIQGAQNDAKREGSLLKRERKVESPLPGHPTSDIVTALFNRIFEQVDVVLRPAPK